MERIKRFIVMSKEEYEKFKKTNNEDYLAQAGEKLWNVFNMLIQKRTKKKIRNFATLRKMVGEIFGNTGDRLVIDLFYDTYELHKYFYRGHADTKYIEEIYLNALYGIEILYKKWVKSGNI